MPLKLPLCKNPDHPPDASRSMLCVGETDKWWEFGCVGCRDIRKVFSAQVVMKPAYRQHISGNKRLQQYKKARMVERDPLNGRVTYFR